MAEFTFNCPQCGQPVEADESFCGQTVECPRCGKGIVVPSIKSSSVSEAKTQPLYCPNCGNACEVDGELAIGQHLICPFCSEKFTYPGTEQGSWSLPHGGHAEERRSEEITTKCPHCGTLYEVEQSYLGQEVTCDSCGRNFVIADMKSSVSDSGTGMTAQESVEDEIAGNGDAKTFERVKTLVTTAENKTIIWWKNGKEGREAFLSKVKAAAIAAKDKTVALWNSGRKGKGIVIAAMVFVLCVIMFLLMPCEKGCTVPSKGEVVDNTYQPESIRSSRSEGKPIPEKPMILNREQHSKAPPDIRSTRFYRILKLAEAAAADGDTINFYGFFPGMSRHDAQFLAEAYGLDGNVAHLASLGENGVFVIDLGINNISKILRMMKIPAQTFEEIAQAVANAVGDLQSKGVRNLTGNRWGGRTYVDEHVRQWYERALVCGAKLTLTKTTMRIVGDEKTKSEMPVETAEAKKQRIQAEKTVISDLLRNMVDIPVTSSDMKPFKMGKYEVTQLQWVHVMGKNPSEHMPTQIGSRDSGDRPIDNVSWNDCQEFLKEFNALSEVKETGLTFRLPTAEEWEHACRAGAIENICKLSDGREITKSRIANIAWIDVGPQTKPVGLKTPNAYGLFDMVGNVSEWTMSWDKEYKDRCIYLGGDCSSRWDDESSKQLWRESSNYGSNTRGFRLCATKNNGEKQVKGIRRFGETCKIGEHTWKYDVIDGNATIIGVSPKTGDIKIPSKIGDDSCPVTSIGYRALADCREMTRLTIPNSIIDIGEAAFHGCRGLEDLTIPDSVKNIGKEAFDWCKGLTNVTIGNAVTNIGEQAFYNCDGLTSITIPDSVITFDARAFHGCGSLTSVTIGNGVTSIGTGAFSEFGNLTSVMIGNGVTNIGGKAFNNCRKLVSLKIGDGVTSIGNDAFELCESLTNVRLPNSLVEIGDGAFASCKGLTSIKIPDFVVNIGNGAFKDCDGLTSLKIGKRVVSIGAGAFIDCSGLTVVDIPGTVEVIGGDKIYGAFMRCGLTRVTIGNGVKDIGPYAFWACNNLKSVEIPDSVTSIGEEAFNQCSALTSVRIGNGVTSIGEEAFHCCSKLKSVSIPDSVTSIGKAAFGYCHELKSVKIGEGVTSIIEDTFKDCNALTDLTIGNSVACIGKEAFSGCSSLASVKIPSSVTTIGSEAFYNCCELTRVTIPDSVNNIGARAFSGCSNLKNVKAPKCLLPLDKE